MNEMHSEEKYLAFISYRRSGKDAVAAKRIQESLESFRVPSDLVKARGYPGRLRPIFRDDSDLPATSDLPERIRNELRQSRFLIVVCSPRASDSEWMDSEIREFRNLGRSDRILAVLIAGDYETAVPPALKNPGEKNMSGLGRVPLAVDMRGPEYGLGRPALRTTTLKLSAALLGCGFDDLVQRSKAREAKIRNSWIAVVAGTLSLFLVLGGFAWRADAARKSNLAFAHFSKGIENEAKRDLMAAKVHFAKSVSLRDFDQARKKAAETWNTASLLWERRLPFKLGHQQFGIKDELLCVRFSRNGEKIFVGTSAGELLEFSSENGRFLESTHFGSGISKLAVHPSDDRIAVGRTDGEILVMDAKNGRIQLRSDFAGPITALEFNHDGRALGVGLGSGGMRVIDAESGEDWFASPPGYHERAVLDISFSKGGSELIWSMGRRIYTANFATGRMSPVAPQDDEIIATGWSGGSDPLLAWAGEEGPIQIMRRHDDVAEGRSLVLGGQSRVQPMMMDLRGHHGGAVTSLEFLSDSEILASAGEDGLVQLWNARTGTLILSLTAHKGGVRSFSVSKEGERLASVGYDGCIRTWRIGPVQGSEVWRLDRIKGHGHPLHVNSFLISNLLSTRDGSLIIGLQNGTVARTVPGEGVTEILIEGNSTEPRRHTWGVDSRGSQLCLRSDSGLTLFDLPKMVKRRQILAKGLSSVDYADSESLVFGSEEGEVLLIDKATGDLRKGLGRRNAKVVSVSTRGGRIAALWADGEARVWQSPQYNEVLAWRASGDVPDYLSLSPDGKNLVITMVGDGRSILLNVDSKSTVFDQPLLVRSAVFSPDSRKLALGLETEASIRILDVRSGKELESLVGSGRRIVAQVFDRSSRILYSTGDDRKISRWSLSDLDLVWKTPGNRLLDDAVASTGLTPVGLDYMPNQTVPTIPDSYHSRKEVNFSVDPVDRFIWNAQGQIRTKIGYSFPWTFEGRLFLDHEQEDQLRELLAWCSDSLVAHNKHEALSRLRILLQTLLAESLWNEKRTKESLAFYREAWKGADQALADHGYRFWPILFMSIEKYASALRSQGNYGEAFAVERWRIRTDLQCIKSNSELTPPLVDLWDAFNRAMVGQNLPDVRAKGFILATEVADFLETRYDSLPEDPELPKGLYMFYREIFRLSTGGPDRDKAMAKASYYRNLAENFHATGGARFRLSAY
jgi:WD40 repeat protein